MLEITQLQKHFQQNKAVDGCSLTLQPGITGLLGANGSGKTTMMRMITGVLEPDGGTITWNGTPITRNKEMYLRSIGYLPQQAGMYPSFTVEKFLRYMGAMKGLHPSYTEQRIQEILPLVHLEEQRRKKIRSLSGGMKQRVGIAQALLSDPELLIFDEPTAGLDPAERNAFARILRSLAKDHTVLLSTHIVSDVEHLADRVIVMEHGRILADDTPGQLCAALQGQIKEIQLPDEVLNTFCAEHLVMDSTRNENGWLVRYQDAAQTTQGTPVTPTLNDVYLSLTQEVPA